MKIFGREPAAVLGLLSSALALAVAVGLNISNEQVGLIMAVIAGVFGVIVGWSTRDTILGVVVGLAQAVLALFVGFGIELSPELSGAIIAFISLAFGFFNRTQTSPDNPAFR